jgi:PIN domain nuclease of toxin-antitoxin system
VRILLDTHVFLWYITGDERVGRETRILIENSDAAYLSVASVWEATIKYQLGKLPLPETPFPWLVVQREQHGIESLAMDESTIVHLANLPPHHRDPFDRILICQAIQHDLQIVTVDKDFSLYPAKLIRPA